MGSVAREEEGLLLDEVLVEKRPHWCSTYRHCMDLLVDNPLCISSRVLWALLQGVLPTLRQQACQPDHSMVPYVCDGFSRGCSEGSLASHRAA